MNSKPSQQNVPHSTKELQDTLTVEAKVPPQHTHTHPTPSPSYVSHFSQSLCQVQQLLNQSSDLGRVIDRVFYLIIGRLAVRSLTAPICIPKYPWAIYWTPSCSVMHSYLWMLDRKHLDVAKGACVNFIKCCNKALWMLEENKKALYNNQSVYYSII